MIFNPIIASGGGTGEVIQAAAVAHIKPGSPVYLMTAPYYELTGQTLSLEDVSVSRWTHCAASPDGSMVVVSGYINIGEDDTETVVRLLRVTDDILSDGGILPSLPSDKSIYRILWSSKGLLLILMGGAAVFYTISGSQLSYTRQISVTGQCAAFSPDGSLLVIDSDLYTVSGSNVDKIGTVPYKADSASVSGYEVNQVSFSPDGAYLYVTKEAYLSGTGSYSAVDIMRVAGNQLSYLSTLMEGQYSVSAGNFVENGAVFLINYIWDIFGMEEPVVPSMLFKGDTVSVYQQTRIDMLGTAFDGSGGLEESVHYMMTHMGVGIPALTEAASHNKMICTEFCLSACGERGIVGTQMMPQISGDMENNTMAWLPDGRLVILSSAAAGIAKRGADRLVAGEIMGGLDASLIQGVGTALTRAAPDAVVTVRRMTEFA